MRKRMPHRRLIQRDVDVRSSPAHFSRASLAPSAAVDLVRRLSCRESPNRRFEPLLVARYHESLQLYPSARCLVDLLHHKPSCPLVELRALQILSTLTVPASSNTTAEPPQPQQILHADSSTSGLTGLSFFLLRPRLSGLLLLWLFAHLLFFHFLLARNWFTARRPIQLHFALRLQTFQPLSSSPDSSFVPSIAREFAASFVPTVPESALSVITCWRQSQIVVVVHFRRETLTSRSTRIP